MGGFEQHTQERDRPRKRAFVALVALVFLVGVGAALAKLVVAPALDAEAARQETLRKQAEQLPNYGWEPDATVAADEASLRADAERVKEELEDKARADATLGDHFPSQVHGIEKPVWPARAVKASPGSRRLIDAGVDDPLAGQDSL